VISVPRLHAINNTLGRSPRFCLSFLLFLIRVLRCLLSARVVSRLDFVQLGSGIHSMGVNERASERSKGGPGFLVWQLVPDGRLLFFCCRLLTINGQTIALVTVSGQVESSRARVQVQIQALPREKQKHTCVGARCRRWPQAEVEHAGMEGDFRGVCGKFGPLGPLGLGLGTAEDPRDRFLALIRFGTAARSGMETSLKAGREKETKGKRRQLGIARFVGQVICRVDDGWDRPRWRRLESLAEPWPV
jgi:hypothetical protein